MSLATSMASSVDDWQVGTTDLLQMSSGGGISVVRMSVLLRSAASNLGIKLLFAGTSSGPITFVHQEQQPAGLSYDTFPGTGTIVWLPLSSGFKLPGRSDSGFKGNDLLNGCRGFFFTTQASNFVTSQVVMYLTIYDPVDGSSLLIHDHQCYTSLFGSPISVARAEAGLFDKYIFGSFIFGGSQRLHYQYTDSLTSSRSAFKH